MKIYVVVLMYCVASLASAAGKVVDYTVNNEPYQGYYTSPSKNAPLVLLFHDWDGLTEYEIKRAEMLASMGYAAFTVFGSKRYRENADKQSWALFTGFLKEVSK